MSQTYRDLLLADTPPGKGQIVMKYGTKLDGILS